MIFSSKRICMIISTVLFTIIFLFLVLDFFLIILNISKFSNTNEKPRSHSYQFTQVNPFDKTSTNGFTYLPRSLEREDFITYFNIHSKSTVIITNFGGTEYSCTGTCICQESEHNSRRVSHILSRGIIILISAFSTSMAYQIAKKTFDTQCYKRFHDTCETSVLSEVEDCTTSITQESDDESDLDFRDSPDEEEGKTYICSGYCLGYDLVNELTFFLSFPGVGKEEFLRLGYEQVGFCEELKLEKEVVVPKSDEMKRVNEYHEEVPTKLGIPNFLFIKPLDDFCKSQSLISPKTLSEMAKEEILKRRYILKRDIEEYELDVPEEESKKEEYYDTKIGVHGLIRDMKKWTTEGIPFCAGVMLVDGEEGGESKIFTYDKGPGKPKGEILEHIKCIKK